MDSVIGVLEGKNKTEKIEVLFERQEGLEGCLYLRLLSWGEGIGWYPQKTIGLECREIDALQTILKRAEALIKITNRPKPRSKGKVVPFPLRRKGMQALERRALKEA